MNNTLETKFRKLIKEDDVKLTFQIFAIGFVSNIGIWLYKVGATDTNINGLFYYTSDWEISLGRWLIPIMDKFRFYFCFPILSSIISLLYFSIATVISLNVLDIKDKILKIIVGGMFIVTPCVGFSLTFFYCSDSYSMAMILASLFVYLIKKDFSLKNSFLAFFCIIGLFALYQAYISYAATLGLSFLIICLIKQDSFEYIIKKGLNMFVCALLGAIAYYLITLLVHHFTGIQFASYAGANSLSKTTVLDIKIAIASSYQKFYELFMNFMGIKSTSFLRSSYIFYLISSCVLVSLLLLIINEKIYKNPLRLLILFGTLVIYPFVNGIILIVVKYHGIHNLMIQSYYIIFLLFASIIDICQNKECKIKWLNAFVISFVFSVLMVIFAFEHLAINNATYEYFNIKRNKMVSIANRILEKAENLPDYCEECKFAFAGSLDSSYPIESYLSNLSFSEENILEPADYFQNKAVIENIYREDVGCYINICDDDTYTNIVNSKEYSDMPVYPKNGSIQMIDDIIVVKLSDDIFLP